MSSRALVIIYNPLEISRYPQSWSLKILNKNYLIEKIIISLRISEGTEKRTKLWDFNI